MKKAFLSLFLIALAAVLTISCAAEPPMPPMENPELLYGDTYFENGSDGSEVILFYLLDAANDEQNEVTDETALVITEHTRIGDKEFVVLNNVWQNSEFGKVFICSFDIDGCNKTYYMTSKYVYYTTDGVLTEKVDEESMGGLPFEEFVSNYHFPYGPIETMLGMYQDENGYTYFLVKSTEFEEFEYVAGEGLFIEQMRYYMYSDGIWQLFEYLDYSIGAPVEIPEFVLAEMRSDFAGSEETVSRENVA